MPHQLASLSVATLPGKGVSTFSLGVLVPGTWYPHSRQKEQKKGGETAAATYLVRITSRTIWTTHAQTGGGACCKRPRHQGTYAPLTCFFGLVATCDVHGTCPTLKLPLVLNLIQMGPQKSKYSALEIPRPGRYTNIKRKNRQKIMQLFIRTSMQLSTYHVCNICRNPIPPASSSLLVNLTWRGVWCCFLVLSTSPA